MLFQTNTIQYAVKISVLTVILKYIFIHNSIIVPIGHRYLRMKQEGGGINTKRYAAMVHSVVACWCRVNTKNDSERRWYVKQFILLLVIHIIIFLCKVELIFTDNIAFIILSIFYYNNQ